MRYGRSWGRLGMIYKLSDLCDYVKEKIDVKELTRKNYISTENMLPNKRGISIASSIPSILQTQAFKKGDILISNIRPYFKKIWYAEYDGGCSNDVLVLRAKKGVNKQYLYYLLADDRFFDYAMAFSKGTKMPRGDKTAIMNYSVISFSNEKQDNIAEILNVLDKKIFINDKINRNLQEQAASIYRKMILDAPDECNEGVLSDIAEIIMGQSPKGDTYNEEGKGTVFYQGRAEFGERFPNRRLFTTDPKRMAKENSVLVSVRAPVGDINVAYEECCIGRGLSSVVSKDNHQSFVLYTMFSLKDQFDVYNGEGTVFGSINKESMNGMAIHIPNENLMDEFEEIVSSMDAIIKANYEENYRLIAVRDALLPKLMSGELDILDLNI